MADLNSGSKSLVSRNGSTRPSQSARASRSRPHDDLLALMELLFFAYRDFTGDPDAVLSEYGFGRAHHRVLHFVDRHPGLRVADLLVILRITKQSLARVLKQLVDEGFILQEEDPTDRRARLLYTTPKGQALYDRLIEMQLARIHEAADTVGPAGLEKAREFLFEMIGHEHRERIEHLMRSAKPARSGAAPPANATSVSPDE